MPLLGRELRSGLLNERDAGKKDLFTIARLDLGSCGAVKFIILVYTIGGDCESAVTVPGA